ncbi:MAG: hypothetical protein VX574_11255, partial [Myxococcota bacterium]|nr:hypothetical protein [Myxococcota bacterium]
RATDERNATLEKVFAITVTDVFENSPPSFADANATFTTAENNASAFLVAATDPDADANLVYSKSGPDAGKFILNVATGQLTFSNPPDYENPTDADQDGVYEVILSVTDGTASSSKDLRITVGDVFENRAPTSIDLNGTSVAENLPAATILGEFNATDPDLLDHHSFSFAGPDGNLALHDTLVAYLTNDVVEYNGTFWKALADLAPHGIHDPASSYAEGHRVSNGSGKYYQANSSWHNTAAWASHSWYDAGTIVSYQGKFYRSKSYHKTKTPTTRPDYWDLLDLSLNGSSWNDVTAKATPGGAFWEIFDPVYDNHQFNIDVNGTLKTATILDHEANATRIIRVKATDEHNASFEKTFTITVLDDPADNNASVADSNATVSDNNGTAQDTNATVQDTNATAPDTNGTIPDANATIPDVNATGADGNATVPDTNATVPDTNGTIPDANATVPDVNATVANGNATVPDTNATVPDNNVTIPDTNATAQDTNATVQDTNGTIPDVNATVPDVNATVADGNATVPDTNATIPDTNATVPDTNATLPDTNPTLSDSNVTIPDGNATSQDGNATVSDGNATVADTNATATDSNATITDGDATSVSDENESVVITAPIYPPIARTLPGVVEANGKLRLSGRILTDGGSPVTGVGFLLSSSLRIDPDDPETVRLAATLSGTNFGLLTEPPDPGRRIYFRTFARNAAGETYGVRKRVNLPDPPATPQPWWSAIEEAAAGWRHSPWFGAFLPYSSGWLYHADLGWLYAQPDGTDGLWLWMEGKGWLWTNPGAYPYLFRHEGSVWLYFLKRKDGRARFHDHTTGGVE